MTHESGTIEELLEDADLTLDLQFADQLRELERRLLGSSIEAEDVDTLMTEARILANEERARCMRRLRARAALLQISRGVFHHG